MKAGLGDRVDCQHHGSWIHSEDIEDETILPPMDLNTQQEYVADDEWTRKKKNRKKQGW